MKVKITTLAPVHIGSGDTLAKLDFWIENNKFNRVDIDSLLEDKDALPYLKTNPLTSDKRINEIFPLQLLNKHKSYELPIHRSCTLQRVNQVKEYIKSKNKVYIPGSSLKGAILSGVIYYIATQKQIQPNLYKEYNDFLEEIFKNLSITNNQRARFSQWLNVTDSNLLEIQNTLELSCAYVTYKKDKKKGLHINYETLKIGTSFEVELATSIDNFKFGRYEPQQILEFATKFYEKIYNEEKALNFIVLPEIPPKSYLLRIGQGSTKLSTSLMLLERSLNPKTIKLEESLNPKTIKLIDNMSMGWISVQLC
jgi:CRISPR type III-A-associated RAMP protein Csm5